MRRHFSRQDRKSEEESFRRHGTEEERGEKNAGHTNARAKSLRKDSDLCVGRQANENGH